MRAHVPVPPVNPRANELFRLVQSGTLDAESACAELTLSRAQDRALAYALRSMDLGALDPLDQLLRRWPYDPQAREHACVLLLDEWRPIVWKMVDTRDRERVDDLVQQLLIDLPPRLGGRAQRSAGSYRNKALRRAVKKAMARWAKQRKHEISMDHGVLESAGRHPYPSREQLREREALRARRLQAAPQLGPRYRVMVLLLEGSDPGPYISEFCDAHLTHLCTKHIQMLRDEIGMETDAAMFHALVRAHRSGGPEHAAAVERIHDSQVSSLHRYWTVRLRCDPMAVTETVERLLGLEPGSKEFREHATELFLVPCPAGSDALYHLQRHSTRAVDRILNLE